jgi:diguanylate cyclase (GGDEF)-like protein/PAS domain S-box-containing protein
LNAPRTHELILPQTRVESARVAALFGIAKTAYAATLAAGGLIVAMLWGSAPAAQLALWFGALAAATLARLALHRSYTRDAARRAPLAWERRFAAGAFAAGLLWATPVALFYPAQDALLQMALILVTACAVVGAAGVYAASAPAFYAFCVLPILTCVAQLALQPGGTAALLALGGAVFTAAMVRVYRDMHANLVSALRTRAEKEMLLERVAQSESRLRDAIEGFPEGIAVFDEQDRLAVCNEEYARVYGRGRDAAALAGATYGEIAQAAYDAELFAPGPAPGREAWVAERMARRRGADDARQFRTLDGRWKQGHCVATQRGASVSVFSDITDAKRAQAAYQAALAAKDLVLDALPVGVAFVENRVIASCNTRLERMLGYAAGELAGRPARVLYDSDAAWRNGASMYEQLRSGALYEGDGELVRKDGALLWCRAWARTLNPEAPQEAAIIVFSDVSERRAAEHALAASEALYRSLVETSNDLVWSIDREGRWTYLNPEAVRRIYGGRPAELLGQPMHARAALALRERDNAVLGRVLAGETVFRHETRHQRGDDASVDLSFNAVPLRDAQGAIIGAAGTARDISEERTASAALHEGIEKLRLAIDAADLRIWEWDVASDRLQWGRGPLVGGEDTSMTTMAQFRKRVHPEDEERFVGAAAAAQGGAPFGIEVRLVGRDGDIRWSALRGKFLFDAAGHQTRMIGVSQDITARKRREEEERFFAYHDTLTGLPNRRLLDDRLRQALHLAQRRNARLAVLQIDLDEFKQINDRFGHRVGDAALREVAVRLGGCVRKADTLARQGGDEFVVVIPELAQDGDCEIVAQKILRALAEPLAVEGEAVRVGASVGISLYPGDAGDGEALLRNADAAMYRAKHAGGNQIRYYGR